MFHHPEHFLLCLTSEKSCVIDAKYTIIGDDNCGDEDIYAVIVGFEDDEIKARMAVEDDYFEMVAMLLEELL